MAKTNFSKRLWIVAGFALVMVLQSTNAFARDRGRQRPHEVTKVGHQRYNYHDGRFYKPGWFWFEIALVHPPMGAVVTFLPFGHSSVVIGGLRYYHHNNIYYKACPSGYVVVPMPVANQNVIAGQNLSGEKVAVNIPNSNGSYTTITLVRQKDGFIGPQGEYYPGNPTIEQLKALYAK
jgi:hypothetical protein